MTVHRRTRLGFQEVINQRCLVIELERVGLPFIGEQEQSVFYDGIQVTI